MALSTNEILVRCDHEAEHAVNRQAAFGTKGTILSNTARVFRNKIDLTPLGKGLATFVIITL